jgi:NAD-dependent SIR2 family protein deacetylase
LLHDHVLGGYPRANKAIKGADLCLALGSSLTVYPPAFLTGKAKRIVIVNPQATPVDKKAALR